MSSTRWSYYPRKTSSHTTSIPTLSSLRLRLHCPPLDNSVFLEDLVLDGDTRFLRRIKTTVIVSLESEFESLPKLALACYSTGINNTLYILVPHDDFAFIDDGEEGEFEDAAIKIIAIQKNSGTIIGMQSVLLFKDDFISEIEERARFAFQVSYTTSTNLLSKKDNTVLQSKSSMKSLTPHIGVLLLRDTSFSSFSSESTTTTADIVSIVQTINTGLCAIYDQISGSLPTYVDSSAALTFEIDWTTPVIQMAQALSQVAKISFGRSEINGAGIRLAFLNAGVVSSLLKAVQYLSCRDRSTREALEASVQALTNIAFLEVVQLAIVNTDGALRLLVARAKADLNSHEVVLKIARCISTLAYDNNKAKVLAVSNGAIAMGVEALRIHSGSKFCVEKLSEMLCSVLNTNEAVSELLFNDVTSAMAKIETHYYSSESMIVKKCFAIIRSAIDVSPSTSAASVVVTENMTVLEMAIQQAVLIDMIQQTQFLPAPTFNSDKLVSTECAPLLDNASTSLPSSSPGKLSSFIEIHKMSPYAAASFTSTSVSSSPSSPSSPTIPSSRRKNGKKFKLKNKSSSPLSSNESSEPVRIE